MPIKERTPVDWTEEELRTFLDDLMDQGSSIARAVAHTIFNELEGRALSKSLKDIKCRLNASFGRGMRPWELIFERPLSDMPLMVNNKRGTSRDIALCRLRIGK